MMVTLAVDSRKSCCRLPHSPSWVAQLGLGWGWPLRYDQSRSLVNEHFMLHRGHYIGGLADFPPVPLCCFEQHSLERWLWYARSSQFVGLQHAEDFGLTNHWWELGLLHDYIERLYIHGDDVQLTW